MKNRLLNNIIAIVLAQLVLFASTSFVLNFHLCENHIQSFSLLGQATSCKTMSCDLSSLNGSMQMKKSCCTNTQIIGTAHQFHKSHKIEINKINYTVSLIPQIEIAILNQNFKKDYFQGYSPPLQTCNFKILYQSFLI
ncbi:MAG: hypothetical protein QM486_10680 [Flavobacteriaceae bacterium]